MSCPSGKHLLSLINEILDLAKVEAGKMELHSSRRAAGRHRGGAQHHAAAGGQEIDRPAAECDESFGPIPMDGARIKQVLLNLVGNAVKFTPETGKTRSGQRREQRGAD